MAMTMVMATMVARVGMETVQPLMDTLVQVGVDLQEASPNYFCHRRETVSSYIDTLQHLY